MEKILYLRDVERVIKDYFIECVNADMDSVELTEANAELCQRMEGVAFVSMYGLPGDPVWFLLEDNVLECGWYLSEERVAALGSNGFYVPGTLDPNYDPSNVTYVPYTDVGIEVFFTEEEAIAALKAKEAKEGADQCQN